jgi:hypothetical protein
MIHLETFFCEGLLLPIFVRRPNIDRDLFLHLQKVRIEELSRMDRLGVIDSFESSDRMDCKSPQMRA